MTYHTVHFFVIGYLIGSIPFGLVLCHLFKYGDIRKIGSGNIGTTNVLRTGNKLLALTTLILDSSKGFFYVFFLLNHTGNLSLTAWISLSVIIGHNFPVWLKFKGGKGIATTFGILIALTPYIGLSVIGIWLIMSRLFKISSLSALIALPFAPICILLFTDKALLVQTFLFTLLAYGRHKNNIIRLIKGKESKMTDRKEYLSK